MEMPSRRLAAGFPAPQPVPFVPYDQRGRAIPSLVAERFTLRGQSEDPYAGRGGRIRQGGWVADGEFQTKDRAHRTPDDLGMIRVHPQRSADGSRAAEGIRRSQKRPGVRRVADVRQHDGRLAVGKNLLEAAKAHRRDGDDSGWGCEIGNLRGAGRLDQESRRSGAIELAHQRCLIVRSLGYIYFLNRKRTGMRFFEQRRAFEREALGFPPLLAGLQSRNAL